VDWRSCTAAWLVGGGIVAGGSGAGGTVSVPRLPSGCGGLILRFQPMPAYNLFILLIGPAIAVAVWAALTRSTAGRMVRAAALDREMLGAMGANVGAIYTWMFVVSSFLAGLSGALVTPIQSIVPGMDVEIIVEAFIVVVIGGLGSFWGTFWGSVIYGQVLSFGILVFPSFSIFSVFALMAVILIIRPWGLFGRPIRFDVAEPPGPLASPGCSLSSWRRSWFHGWAHAMILSLGPKSRSMRFLPSV